MPVTGKTGADAVFVAIHRIVIVLSHYTPKFMAVIDAAQAAGAISALDAAAIKYFVTNLNDLFSALEKLAKYSGF